MSFEAFVAALVVVVGTWTGTWYPEGKGPETQAQEQARRVMIVEEVSGEALRNDTMFRAADAAAAVLMVWKHETRLDYYVHAGQMSPIGSQDLGLARCLGQIQWWPGHRYLTQHEHRALAGLSREATRRCAHMTLRYLWAHADRCIRLEEGKRSSVDRWDAKLTLEEVAVVSASYGKWRCVPAKKRHRTRAVTFESLRRQLEK